MGPLDINAGFCGQLICYCKRRDLWLFWAVANQTQCGTRSWWLTTWIIITANVNHVVHFHFLLTLLAAYLCAQLCCAFRSVIITLTIETYMVNTVNIIPALKLYLTAKILSPWRLLWVLDCICSHRFVLCRATNSTVRWHRTVVTDSRGGVSDWEIGFISTRGRHTLHSPGTHNQISFGSDISSWVLSMPDCMLPSVLLFKVYFLIRYFLGVKNHKIFGYICLLLSLSEAG